MMQQVTSGEFDHPAAHTAVAHLGESSLASSLPALVWSSAQTGISREGPPIPDFE